MDIRQLKHFIAIAEEGSLSAASARLHVAQTIERYARQASCHMNVAIEMDALSQIKELVVRGSGFTILTPAATHDRVSRQELVMSRIVDPAARLSGAQSGTAHDPGPAGRSNGLPSDVVDDLIKRHIWAEGKPHATS